MIGSSILRYESVVSTNDLAKELARDGAEEGTVVVAAEQTKGRGSRGRYWISPPGANLLASVILRLDISPERVGELAFVAAIAVARAVRSCYGLEARIKWPNDVRVRDRKISGILVEVAEGAAIVGIGVNANWADLPEEIAETATSLLIELGRPVVIDDILSALMSCLDTTYAAYRETGFDQTLAEWMELQDTIGRDTDVEWSGGCVSGRAIDVDARGGLVVELADGTTTTVSAGVVVS